MAVLSDENLASYKTQIDNLNTQISAWSAYLKDAESELSSSTGTMFRLKYSKGLKATTNIKIIIDILQSVQKDLKALVDTANAFYTTSLEASKK